jgi:uncharacterized protein YbjT (DUF2867 family)
MKPILITGASGYIGGRLVPQLAEAGHLVRCLARDPRRLSGRGWGDGVDVVRGDVLDRDTLAPALAGCGAAYYLVHSMAVGERGFAERDRQAARNFAEAAAEAGLERIVYLGGLGRRHEELSAHLSSRHEVGDVLRAGPVPAIELRAAMIIGAGSASFEMLRALVERLPVMICPKWVKTRSQPIAVRDVLAYLAGCLEIPVEPGGAVYDIGGPEVLTYREMMLRFAAILGLKRYIIDVPVLTPRLSAYWVNLMTPVPAGIAFPLIEGLKAETICEDDRIRRLIPFEPIGFDEAVRRALDRIRRNDVTTRWTNASTRRRRPEVEFDPDAFPIKDEQVMEADAPAAVLFDRVRRIGGDVGWYYAGALWRIRGGMDRLIGGVGLRRGRRDPVKVWTGDAIDFWRVGDFVPDRRLLLHAEMKVPGDAWLEFRVRPLDDGRSELTQTAYFRPSPFWGHMYWYALYPVHELIFRGMARNIARAAEREARAVATSA